MKIAYTISTFYPLSETFNRDLAVGLHERAALKVYTFQRMRNGADADHLDIKIVSRPLLKRVIGRFALYANRLLPKRYEFFDRVKFWVDESAFRKRLLSDKPDLIYADFGNVGILTLAAAKQLEIPIVVHFHGVDASAKLASKFYAEKVTEVFEYERSRVIAPSNHLARRLKLCSGHSGDICVIPYQPKRSLADRCETVREKYFCAVGRMVDKKAPLAVIEAFKLVRKRLPDVKLIYVGGGALFEPAKKRVEHLGLVESVNLLGACPHAETLDILARCTVFIQHSVTGPDGDQEGLPVAILEALKMHIPVVSTIHSGIPEAVFDGENGYLVREHDYEAMAVAMEKAIFKKTDEWDFSKSDELLSVDRIEKIYEMFVQLSMQKE